MAATTTICNKCNEQIDGKMILALQKHWHPEHFVCQECQKPIAGIFHEHDGQPYCETDYTAKFSMKCAHCKEPIKDKFIRALKEVWHQDHFICSTCSTPLAGQNFLERDGKAYCEEDYHSMFSPRCKACEKPIVDAAIQALGGVWHQDCFKCVKCHRAVGDNVFRLMGTGMPLCTACPADASEDSKT